MLARWADFRHGYVKRIARALRASVSLLGSCHIHFNASEVTEDSLLMPSARPRHLKPTTTKRTRDYASAPLDQVVVRRLRVCPPTGQRCCDPIFTIEPSGSVLIGSSTVQLRCLILCVNNVNHMLLCLESLLAEIACEISGSRANPADSSVRPLSSLLFQPI